jgi:hypothetical protein
MIKVRDGRYIEMKGGGTSNSISMSKGFSSLADARQE